MLKIMLFVLLIYTVYTVLPTVLVRLAHFGAVSRAAQGKNSVVLTFDDGPDPRYTPRILKILKRHQIKACFFINGVKAKAYPDLTKQIASAGHIIGNHGYRHKAAWLLGPRATISEITKTNLILEEITGKKTIYHRPTWGLHNLVSLWYYWNKDLKVILWTYMSWDWSKRATPAGITSRTLNKLRDGAILILHDGESAGAATGGPERVITALPGILQGITRRNLQVVSVEEILACKNSRITIKKAALILWSFIDRIIRQLSGIRELEPGRPSLWRLALRRYRGQDWLLQNGVLLQKGDYYLEIHLNNEYLLNLIGENASREHMAVTFLREIRTSLPRLAELMKEDKRYVQAKVLLGITLLHRGTRRLGFTSYDIKPGLSRTIINRYESFLLTLFHPGSSRNAKTYRKKLSPKYVIMTKQELMHRYSP